MTFLLGCLKNHFIFYNLSNTELYDEFNVGKMWQRKCTTVSFPQILTSSRRAVNRCGSSSLRKDSCM